MWWPGAKTGVLVYGVFRLQRAVTCTRMESKVHCLPSPFRYMCFSTSLFSVVACEAGYGHAVVF